jgi:release factor glutamine methyltransferase
MIARDLVASAQLHRGEAETLLATVLSVDRAWLFAHGDDVVAKAAIDRFNELTHARREGEPLAYLLGYCDFWTVRLQVNPHVLIPRRETEHLVEWAIEQIDAGATSVLDMGTGSGAIALSCKASRPAAAVSGLDNSPCALECARENAIALGFEVDWLQSDWFSALNGRTWQLIIANPPYIAADDPHLVQGDLPAEPAGALIGGASGLESLLHIIHHARDYLTDGGWLLLEHGFDQATAVRAALQEHQYCSVSTRSDWSGHERLTGGQWRR